MQKHLFFLLILSLSTSIQTKSEEKLDDDPTPPPPKAKTFFLFGGIFHKIRQRWWGSYRDHGPPPAPPFAGPAFPLHGYYNCPAYGCNPALTYQPAPYDAQNIYRQPSNAYGPNRPPYPVQPASQYLTPQQQQQQNNVVIYHQQDQNGYYPPLPPVPPPNLPPLGPPPPAYPYVPPYPPQPYGASAPGNLNYPSYPSSGYGNNYPVTNTGQSMGAPFPPPLPPAGAGSAPQIPPSAGGCQSPACYAGR